LQPSLHRGAHGFEVGLQAVIARDEHDLAPRPRRWDAERISLPLNDERRNRHRVELREAAFRGSPRGLEREGEAENTDGAGRCHCSAGDPPAERATADDEGEIPELTGYEMLDDRSEGGVELSYGRRRPARRHSVRLLDERDPDALLDRSFASRDEIGRLDPAGRTVPEYERRERAVDRMYVPARQTVGGVDFDDGHPLDGSTVTHATSTIPSAVRPVWPAFQWVSTRRR
jgi:hypothetical protein